MNIRILLFALLAAACGTEKPAANPPPEGNSIGTEDLPALPDGHPDASSLGVLSRGPRRLSVAQLERSLEVAGGFPAGSVQLPGSIAASLGRPDYLQITEESLDPSPLFMKFMVDFAAFLCPLMREADNTRAQDERVLTRYTDVDQNLDYLILRFLSIDGEAAEPYAVRLRAVYDAASVTVESNGWQGVCIALITSPEFLLY